MNNVTVAKPRPESYALIIIQKKGPLQLVISEDANFYVFVFGVNGNLRTVCIGAFTVRGRSQTTLTRRGR